MMTQAVVKKPYLVPEAFSSSSSDKQESGSASTFSRVAFIRSR